MNKVLAVVVTYKRKKLLKQVVNSLVGQSTRLSKILIIDNNSLDGTQEVIEQFRDMNPESGIEYCNTGANLGGAGGFEYGFRKAACDEYSHLWLMDDDLVPNQNCLEEMLKLKHEGIVQPVRFNLDGECAELAACSYNLKTVFPIQPKGRTIANVVKNEGFSGSLEIETIPFEGPLISKSVVDAIGFPDARFFIFDDDLEYALKTRKAGFKIITNLNAKATRLLVNNQGDDLLSWKGYFMLRNLFYIFRTYGETARVRNKPLFIALGYAAKCALSFNFKQVSVVFNAFKDSFLLTNTEKFKPGKK